jgi:hypothetical protein
LQISLFDQLVISTTLISISVDKIKRRPPPLRGPLIGLNRNQVPDARKPRSENPALLQVPAAPPTPQFALYASQYAQKAAPLERHVPPPMS